MRVHQVPCGIVVRVDTESLQPDASGSILSVRVMEERQDHSLCRRSPAKNRIEDVPGFDLGCYLFRSKFVERLC